jgi:hypothetical protein
MPAGMLTHRGAIALQLATAVCSTGNLKSTPEQVSAFAWKLAGLLEQLDGGEVADREERLRKQQEAVGL